MKVRLMALIGLALLAGAGCRFRSWESFKAATTPNPPGEWSGDEYTSSGLANSSGGTRPKTRYNAGAHDGQAAPLTRQYGNAAKGAGLRPGEAPVAAEPGHGNSNAPAFQPNASEVGGPSSAYGR